VHLEDYVLDEVLQILPHRFEHPHYAAQSVVVPVESVEEHKQVIDLPSHVGVWAKVLGSGIIEFSKTPAKSSSSY